MSIEQTLANLPASPLALTRRTAAPVVTKPDEKRRAVLERLVREHHTFVWRSAQRLGGRTAELDDIVQEVFVLAARKLDEIRHERGFLFQTCVYVVAHARRGASRRREVVDEDRVYAELDGRPTPEESIVDAEARNALQAILDSMPEPLRAAFVLFELEGLTMIEIAEMTGIAPGTVASRLRRAREMFMSRVERGRGE